MKAAFSSEIFMSAYKATQYHHPEESNLNTQLQETSAPTAKPI
jgi:hypothetical protein